MVIDIMGKIPNPEVPWPWCVSTVTTNGWGNRYLRIDMMIHNNYYRSANVYEWLVDHMGSLKPEMPFTHQKSEYPAGLRFITLWDQLCYRKSFKGRIR